MLIFAALTRDIGLAPALSKLIMSNAVEAYNLPQGIICHLFRAIANNGPGVMSKVGMGNLTST
jgi:propionate CoA-transferase